jgi:hypothetical protein
MVSDKDVANLALIRLGAQLITSLESDRSQRAILCREFLPILRNALLRNYPWAFATRRQQLAEVSGLDEMWDYSHAYQLPTKPKCLRVLKSDADEYDTRWKIEGAYLLTNAEEITISYTAEIEEPGLYDAQFVEVLAMRLAWAICRAITGDDEMVEVVRDEYLLLLSEAEASDSIETTEDEGDQGASVLDDVRR